ncbi:MAG: PilZ domain-containing protein [Sphingobium sp.]|uniref:PilZ domain-containing protein n=1 Tax=Sphingobium sp. TaxID=1912891 RepID=UPI0029B7C0BB|nr:PilZ domain-containing protein [Sphingobium sp.]MDX3908776.1 PilZ domain-containing protein [Sphingobium sp.]
MAEPSFSLPEGTPEQQSRRNARKPLFLRIADSGPDTAVIMDISVGGALLRTAQPLTVNDSVTINLPHGPAAEARVTWSSGPLAGCQFLTPITDAMISAALLKSEPAAPEPNLLLGNDFAQDAPNTERLARGVPIIIASSLVLWGGIAGLIALL